MTITPTAAKKIEETLIDSEYLRIEVNGGGCSGFMVGLTKTNGHEENDIFLSENVVMDTTSAEYLTHATLEWIDDPFASTFKFDIPNTKSCGCGNSFQLEET
tara:strand:+ start:32 stop:337 length:306 start_codon:yes stop_codon:yes gene_type:complete